MTKSDAKRCAELSLDFADKKLKEIPEYQELNEDAKNLLKVICASLVVCKVTDLVVRTLEENLNEKRNSMDR